MFEIEKKIPWQKLDKSWFILHQNPKSYRSHNIIASKSNVLNISITRTLPNHKLETQFTTKTQNHTRAHRKGTQYFILQ